MATDRDAAVAALAMLAPDELADLRERLAALTEGLEPGPFHAMPANRRSDEMFWLDNEAGDSSFPDGDDVALFLNVLPRMLAALDALPGTLDAAWAAVEAALPEGWNATLYSHRQSGQYVAYVTTERGDTPFEDQMAPPQASPAAALLALAEKLREAR